MYCSTHKNQNTYLTASAFSTMSRSGTLPTVYRTVPPVPVHVPEAEMGDVTSQTEGDFYSTPKVPAKVCHLGPTGAPPTPAARKKIATSPAKKQPLPQSPSSSSVQPSLATSVASRAVQSALESQAQPAVVSEDNFGSCLQSASDCINKRHDDELKALESFRVFMHKRAKADAEYAATLGKIGSQAARDAGSIATGSKIVQVGK